MPKQEEQAKQFAYKAHKGMKRKGKELPFTYHLELVNKILKTLTDDDNILAAGWLHDVIEDTPITVTELKKEFNPKVCYYVDLETEDKSLPWKDRKLKQIEELRRNNFEVALIAYADKMANMTEMFDDYKIIKDELWQRFNRGKEKQYWYYLEFYKIFCYNELIDKEHLKEYEMLLEKLFK